MRKPRVPSASSSVSASRRDRIQCGGTMKTFLLPLVAVAFCYFPASARAQAFPDGPGKDLLERECSSCHAPDMVRAFGRSPEEWREVVITMIDQGAKITDEQVPVLVD